MSTSESVASTFSYGRKLVNAGLSGIREGQPDALNGRPLSSVMTESALQSLALAAAGACVGLLQTYLGRGRARLSNKIAYSVMGGGLGFLVGFGWKNRKAGSSLARSAMKDIHRASDEHWLELHPIDYA